jgi:hypothetical protein
MPLIADISNKVSRLFTDGCYRERDYEEPVVFHDKLYDAALFSFNLGRTIKREYLQVTFNSLSSRSRSISVPRRLSVDIGSLDASHMSNH